MPTKPTLPLDVQKIDTELSQLEKEITVLEVKAQERLREEGISKTLNKISQL